VIKVETADADPATSQLRARNFLSSDALVVQLSIRSAIRILTVSLSRGLGGSHRSSVADRSRARFHPGIFIRGFSSGNFHPGITVRGLLCGDCCTGIAVRGLLYGDCCTGITVRGFPFGDCCAVRKSSATSRGGPRVGPSGRQTRGHNASHLSNARLCLAGSGERDDPNRWSIALFASGRRWKWLPDVFVRKESAQSKTRRAHCLQPARRRQISLHRVVSSNANAFRANSRHRPICRIDTNVHCSELVLQ
jgi:hypothetical protein